MDGTFIVRVLAAIALQHSDNVAEKDRKGDVPIMTELLVKYFEVRGTKYPTADDDLELEDG